ncbi:hypothetical protein LSTR_LSTR014244 [Laodelphax striatellus]|uniref:Ig-like domain-containing protein n=1 Tax=Laodelphax striatellus TaxID=195883 RepID=A0A482WV76_LAOST|nr:hypothetical protein LSTR_LSTR014244 [Laodelphax striatellus]
MEIGDCIRSDACYRLGGRYEVGWGWWEGALGYGGVRQAGPGKRSEFSADKNRGLYEGVLCNDLACTITKTKGCLIRSFVLFAAATSCDLFLLLLILLLAPQSVSPASLLSRLLAAVDIDSQCGGPPLPLTLTDSFPPYTVPICTLPLNGLVVVVEINYDSPRGGVSVITEKGDMTTSYLLIQRAQAADSGKYTCNPSNANSKTVVVHVLNEHPAAMQHGGQLRLQNPMSVFLISATVILLGS